MLVDARTVPDEKTFEADLCIVGAGAAGISIARELAGKGLSILVLESGGFDFDVEIQSLYRGETLGPFMPVGEPYLTRARLRYFGGSTNHWEGQCRPLDDIDFEARSWVPDSGWPFPKSRLEPYYERAAALCQIEPFGYDIDDVLSARPALEVGTNDTVETKLFHLSPPTRFGSRYRKDLVEAPDIQVFLHANLVDILANANGNAIDLLQVGCLTGNHVWVRAKCYVLAAGAIENARLLLFSNKLQKSGLGNQNGLVGRYFMEHLNWIAGSVCLTRPNETMSLYEGASPEPLLGNPAFGALCLSEDVQRRHGLLNAGFLLLPRTSVWGLMEAIGHVASEIDRFGEEDPSIREPYFAMLYARTEQSPNPDSRLTLSRELDALGKPRLQLNWQLNASDSENVRESVRVLASELGRHGCGRVSLRITDHNPWPLRPANHPMGTTRMHDDPKKGVVDPDCRVHGIDNLYIAGSSVFPTSGFANPTLTLLALALRLAEQLHNRVRS
ncbi:MAG: FAD-dependent oxidoreductase [Vicinamibacteria bacterium]